MADISSQLEILNAQMTALNVNQNKMMESVEVIEKNVTKLTEDAAKQQKTLQQMKRENEDLRREVEHLKSLQETRLQNDRINDIKISGIPFSRSENLLVLFTTIMNALKLNIPEVAVNAIFRTKTKDSVIVRLLRRFDKESILKAAKQQHLTGNCIGLNSLRDSPIFINESLSPFIAKIFYEARNIQKEFNIKFVWHKDGKVFLRREESQPALQIRSLAEIVDLRKELVKIASDTTLENNPTPSPSSPSANPHHVQHQAQSESQTMEVQHSAGAEYPPLTSRSTQKPGGRIQSWARVRFDSRTSTASKMQEKTKRSRDPRSSRYTRPT